MYNRRARRDGRVVEGNSLENCQRRKLLGGSNPSLSARLYSDFMHCLSCQSTIEITPALSLFLKDLNMGEPRYCALCSWKRKMQWENEYKVYKRSCSATGKPLISIFGPDVPFPVFEREYWLSDAWEAPFLDYDTGRPFLDQYFELFQRAPRPHNNQVNTVNSEYAHLIFDSKDCYLSFQAFLCEKLLYCYRSNKLKDSMNCFFCSESELLYESTNCHHSYRLSFSQDSSNCSESAFLFDCRNCSNCFLSWNLRNKQYCFLNEQLSKEAYEKKVAEFDFTNPASYQKAWQLFEQARPQFIKRAHYVLNSENCTGDFLVNCKNCVESFFTDESQDCQAVLRGTQMKNSFDSVVGGLCELTYNVLQPGWLYRSAYSMSCNHGSEVYFSENCESSSEIIGCIGLRGKKFCILNKPYPEEEYKVLKAQILAELNTKQTADQFFDPAHSPFQYDETIAELYFPQKLPPLVSARAANECVRCGKPMNITKQEIAFAQKMNVCLPSECFHCRIQRLSAPYSVVTLREVACFLCGKATRTSARSGTERIYCEDCYLATLY